MKIKDYFIWEKSYIHNKGMNIKFSLSPYCYIKPTMSSTWNTLNQKPYNQEPMIEYLWCINKIYFWLWFRVTIHSEIRNSNDL